MEGRGGGRRKHCRVIKKSHIHVTLLNKPRAYVFTMAACCCYNEMLVTVFLKSPLAQLICLVFWFKGSWAEE